MTGRRHASEYVDYQARATAFSPGDRVFTQINANPAAGGTVVAVWPAIGMVDVQFAHGSMRYPVEDLVIDNSDTFENFGDFAADSVPGGTPTVSVPGGPDQLKKDEREEITDEELYRTAAAPRRWEKNELDKLPRGHYVSVWEGPKPSAKEKTDWSKELWAFGPFKSEKAADEAEASVQTDVKPNEYVSVITVIGPPKKTANVHRVIEAFVKKALYWDSPDRKYRMTKSEMESGVPTCPRCPGTELRRVIYKREDGKNERLYCCSDCMFLIKRSDIIPAEGL